MEKREQDHHCLLLVPGEDHGQGQVVDTAVESARQRHRDLDGRVGVVALAHVKQPGDAADVAELQLVEAVLAAGKRQDDTVPGHLLGKLGVVVPAALGAVAAADEEEVLHRSPLHRLDHLVCNAEHGVVAEAHQDLLARGVGKAGKLQRLGDHRREVPAVHVLHARPCHQPPGENPVDVGISRLLDAVGVEDYGAGELRELLVLVLPRAAEVAGQVRVFLQARVAVGREHLAMGVDVDPFPLGLFQQLLQHEQVVAGDQDGLARLRSQLHLRRHRAAEALHVGSVQHAHDRQVHLAALHGEPHVVHEPQARVGGGGQRLVEEGVDLVVVLAQDLAVVCVGCHALQSVNQDFDGGTDVLVLVQRQNAVLLTLLHQVPCRRPGRWAVVELAGLDAVCRAEGALVKSPGLLLHFEALPDGRFKAGRIEVHVGDRGEQTFQHEDVDLPVTRTVFTGFIGIDCQSLETVQQVVLQGRNLRLLAAHAHYVASDSLCSLLALMTEHGTTSSFPFDDRKDTGCV